jgi:DNA-nicking Smr family endonuclease
MEEEIEAIRLEIDGTLDLHTFNPREIKELIPDYLQACLEKEIYRVRIIHGKGTGSLRRTVHALLDRETCVSSYRLADESTGSWGATMVVLHPQSKDI